MGKLYTRGEFVQEYGGYIANSVRGTGIHSGTLIAQAFLESGIKKKYQIRQQVINRGE